MRRLLNTENLTTEEKKYGKWSIFYKKIDKEKPITHQLQGGYHCVESPTGFFYADPICVKKDNKYYVFFEHFDFKRGRMAYFTINEDMSASDCHFLEFIEPSDISKIADNHTSYPYVFEYDGAWYMIPETSHSHQIRLYKCTEFPWRWGFVKFLLVNVHAGDTSILHKDNKFWLFTSIYNNNNNHFAIFYSDNLFSEWKEHPINEYYRDNYWLQHMSRGAGLITTGEKITRPCQYSNRNINGEAVILYHINKLTETEFEETPSFIVSKSNIPELRAIHTFSVCDDLLVVDARTPRDIDTEYVDIPNLDETIHKKHNMNIDHNTLQDAFKLNTSGNGMCYYGATIEGVKYEGERDWDKRWDLVKYTPEINFQDRRIIDLGCNMGIFLAYLKKFKNAGRCVGVEATDQFLTDTNKKDTVKAAKLLAKGFNVDIKFVQLDLNKDNYESILGTDYDIAIATSILKWVDDQGRFMSYLSNFNYVIYEGHEGDDTEIQRFYQYGFKFHKILGATQVGKSYGDDQTRTLILFKKSE